MSVVALSFLLLALAVGIGFLGARALGAVTLVESLLIGYIAAFAAVVLLVLALSLAHALSRAALFAGLVVALLVVLSLARLRSERPRATPGVWQAALAMVRSEPLLAPLVAIVVGAVGYSTALAVGTSPVNWDSFSYHLARIAFWLQDGSVGYISNAYDQTLNGHPPNGEIAQLVVFGATGSERLPSLVQLVAALACATGVYGVARRLTHTRPEAAFAALLFLTLPVVLLETSTTQNDLIVASFLVITTFFVLGRSSRDDALAGLSFALAMGTKLTAIYALPLLCGLALVAAPTRRRITGCAAIAVGALAGSYWYVVNLVETGHVFGNLADATGGMTLFQFRRNVTTAFNLLLDSFDLSGAVGADIWLYMIAAAAAALCVAAARRGSLSLAQRAGRGMLVFATGVLPFTLVPLGPGLFHIYSKLISVWKGPISPFDSLQHKVSRVASDSFSWFGPLSLALVIATLISCILLARRHKLGLTEAIIAMAPVFWWLIISASITYDPFRGRFFIFPVALGATLWGRVLRWRSIGAGCVAIAATTVLLCFVHSYEKPSGLQLLERNPIPSVWGEPRWRAQSAIRTEMAPVLRYLEDDVPASTRIALALGPDDWGYLVFGARLTRTVELVSAANQLPAPPPAWVVVAPSRQVDVSATCWRVVLRTHERGNWTILHRINDHC